MRGDRLAQMELYNTYAAAMYNVSLRIMRDTAVAEDIMQESMITALDKLATWNQTATFGAWLKRIVINNSITALRKNGRLETSSYDAHDMYLNTVIDDDNDDVDIEEGMTVKHVLAAMETLNERYKNILNLHLIEGLDHEEISEHLGITNGMCRTTISRAKEQLRIKLTT
jgi:RNA polymerase sigma-70 factor (ECF subfamily)